MKDHKVMKGMTAALLTASVAIPSIGHAAGRMTLAQANLLFQACRAAADATESGVRATGPTKMWCGIVDREGKTLLIKATDTSESPSASMGTDAWRASIEIALAKAYTAASLSSDEQSFSSGEIGVASGTPPTSPDDQTLWGIGNTNTYRALTGNVSLSPDDALAYNHHGIVTFGGGFPIYDCTPNSKNFGLLLGGIGVSGDLVPLDVQVALDAIANVVNFAFSPTPCQET